MSEINNKQNDENKNYNPADDPNNPLSARYQLDKMSCGLFTLEKPIRARSKDVEVLKFDFRNVTGMELVDALDKDTRASNVFRLTDTQALNLFALSAAKETDDVDAVDIVSRISGVDAVKAIQLATIFFTASSRVGNKHISNA